MKQIIKNAAISLIVITLMCTEICLLYQADQVALHPLLIAYLYTLFTAAPLTLLAVLLFLLDALFFLQTGIVGLIFLLITPLSWFALKTKKDLYYKVFAPCLCIGAYFVYTQCILSIMLHYHPSLTHIIENIIINCVCFVVIWRLCKQPFHD